MPPTKPLPIPKACSTRSPGRIPPENHPILSQGCSKPRCVFFKLQTHLVLGVDEKEGRGLRDVAIKTGSDFQYAQSPSVNVGVVFFLQPEMRKGGGERQWKKNRKESGV